MWGVTDHTLCSGRSMYSSQFDLRSRGSFIIYSCRLNQQPKLLPFEKLRCDLVKVHLSAL
jgi:hypothetical protein